MQGLQSSVLSLIKAMGICVCVNDKEGLLGCEVLLQLIKDARVKAKFGEGFEVPQPKMPQHFWTTVVWLGPTSHRRLGVQRVF